RGFFRTARFEQFGDTRQTAGDVARLGRLTRDAGDDVAGFDLGAVLNAQDRTDRQVVYRFGAGWQLLRVAFVILQRHARTQSRHLRLGAPVGNDARGQARRFVRLFTDRDVFDEVGILQRPGDFGD